MAFEKQISFAIILFIAAPYFTFAAEEVCKKTVDLKSCSKLKGLSVKSYGGTVLNEANCDILLPFEIFAKEPTIKFGAAKEVSKY